MARISGIDLPKNKRGVIGLTYIYGIGSSVAKNILDKDLILMIEIINETLVNYQRVNDKRMHIELCLMKIASLDRIKKKNL